MENSLTTNFSKTYLIMIDCLRYKGMFCRLTYFGNDIGKIKS